MFNAVTLGDEIVLRIVTSDDAAPLLESYLRNREHLRPFDPQRPDSFWTLEGQQDRLGRLARQRSEGKIQPFVMWRDGTVLGCVTLHEIDFGPRSTASIGYWVDAEQAGKGLASAAASAACRIADEELGLHRVEASTNLANVASQRVLIKSGFEQFGTARDYIYVNGSWQDSLLFQRILNDRPPAFARG